MLLLLILLIFISLCQSHFSLFISSTCLLNWFLLVMSFNKLLFIIHSDYFFNLLTLSVECHFSFLRVMSDAVASMLFEISQDASKEDVMIIINISVKYLMSSVMIRSEADIRNMINKWITAQDEITEQFNELRNLFQTVEENLKFMNEILSKIWAVLLNRKIWRAKFFTQTKILKVIDISLLKKLRQQALSNRNRKEKYVHLIKMRWKGNVDDWSFDRLKENYLDAIMMISKRYNFKKATTMIIQVIVTRLQKVKSDRESMCQIITSDWQKLKRMNRDIAIKLLMKTTSSSEKLIALELNLLRLIFSKHETFNEVSLSWKWIWYVNRKNKDETEWNKKDSDMMINADEVVRLMSDSNSDKEILNEEVLDEMYENDESIEETSDCKCSEILKMILKRVCRKSFTVVDMMNEMKCINTLRIFVKTDFKETSLMHVYHKHLLRLADYFNLQVKMLNSAELRNWLCQCWEHRSDLIAFKTSSQSTL